LLFKNIFVTMNFLLRAARLRPSLAASLAAPLHTSPAARKTFEPDYLDTEGVAIPTYPPINIQVPGAAEPDSTWPSSDEGIQL
jgi:hypothetical protein